MQLSSFGDQRVISNALETGTIQGGALAGIFSRTLARKGYWIPGEPAKIALTGTGLVLKADYLQNQAPIARSVLRSLIEGHAYVLNPANKSSSMEILSKRLGIKDQSAAADGYEDYVSGVVRKPYVGLDGLKNIQRFMKLRNPKIAELNLEKLIDESFMREFEKSGFLDQQFGVKSAVK
jgi:hypothetical protein